jgi:hypothetical protein
VKNTLLISLSLTSLLLIQACSNTTPVTKFDKPSQTKSSTPSAAITLNKAYFKNKLIIEKDNEKGTVKISTVNGFNKKPRNKTNAWANNYITALIDKKTGRTTYQINSLIEYKDHDKHLYKEANYSSGAEPKTKEASILKHDISCLGSAYSGCIHTEHVAFSIGAILIENIAASYSEGAQNKWSYKLSPRKGRDYFAYLFIAEIAALAEAVAENK